MSKKQSIMERLQEAHQLYGKSNQAEIKQNIWKGRIPRVLLLLGSILGIIIIIAAYFDKGLLVLDSFGSYGKYFISLIVYLLLVIISVRANFKCQQITCPAMFSIVYLLGYYAYPPFVKYYGLSLVFIAIYIIVKTIVSYQKNSNQAEDKEKK